MTTKPPAAPHTHVMRHTHEHNHVIYKHSHEHDHSVTHEHPRNHGHSLDHVHAYNLAAYAWEQQQQQAYDDTMAASGHLWHHPELTEQIQERVNR